MQTTRLADANLVTAPDGSEIRELVATSGCSMVHCTLPPGKTSLAVAHRTVDEVWHFISGVGQVWRQNDDAESVVDAEPGLGLSIKVGTHFQFRNTGDDNPCFIITTIPPWSGEDEAQRVPNYWPTV